MAIFSVIKSEMWKCLVVLGGYGLNKSAFFDLCSGKLLRNLCYVAVRDVIFQPALTAKSSDITVTKFMKEESALADCSN